MKCPYDDRAGSLTSSAMPQTADMVEEIASELEVRFVWEPPGDARSRHPSIEAGTNGSPLFR